MRDSTFEAGPFRQMFDDKQQLIPGSENLRALPLELGEVKAWVADHGFLSEANSNH